MINDSDLDQMEYNNKSKRYRLRLKQKDLTNNKDVIVNLLKRSYEAYTGNIIEDEL